MWDISLLWNATLNPKSCLKKVCIYDDIVSVVLIVFVQIYISIQNCILGQNQPQFLHKIHFEVTSIIVSPKPGCGLYIGTKSQNRGFRYNLPHYEMHILTKETRKSIQGFR